MLQYGEFSIYTDYQPTILLILIDRKKAARRLAVPGLTQWVDPTNYTCGLRTEKMDGVCWRPSSVYLAQLVDDLKRITSSFILHVRSSPPALRMQIYEL